MPHHIDAVWGFVVAFAVAVALAPLAGRLARRVGAVDEPRARGLNDRRVPRLGGLAMLAGVLLAGALFLPWSQETRGILAGAAVITLVGGIDDVFTLPPQWKLAGQCVAALIPVLSGVRVEHITLPFIGAVDLGHLGGALTLIGLVAMMNVVNLSDGVDGLAAGVCAIAAIAFSVIAFDLRPHSSAGVLAGIVAGACLGFLVHNFNPARIFMGDAGSNMLGLLLGCIAVQGALKTNAVIALVAPLAVMTVPFLDTGFVIAKRLKYRRAPWTADTNHFHHRMARIGFSQRKTVLYLYAWTLVMAGLAVALRFIPYSDHHGHFHTGWSIVIIALGLLAVAASVYLVYVLEILKFRRVRAWQMHRADPTTSEHDIDAEIERELGTGEFEASEDGGAPPPSPKVSRARRSSAARSG